jgi:hypothetical protein
MIVAATDTRLRRFEHVEENISLGGAPPPGYRGVDAAFDRDRRREELSRQIFAARRRGAVSSVRFTDIGNLLTQCARKTPAHQSV